MNRKIDEEEQAKFLEVTKMAQQNATPTKYIQSNYSIKGVAELSLFDSIDTKKTADNVRAFFKNDFPRIKRMALVTSELQSPVNSDMPKGDTVGNASEDRIVKRLWANNCVNAISSALLACDSQSQLIIRDEYFSNMPRWEISSKLNIEHSQYHRAQREAYNQFADSFEVQDGGQDLHAYKNGTFGGVLREF